MNNWKDLAKHGRHGDTMIKKIDGDLAHVNAVEYEMSPEYIKEHGSGTINPITGKKEYWGWVMPVLSLVSAGVKGMQAQGNKADVEAGRAAVGDIYQEQLDLFGKKRKLETEAAELKFESANIQATSKIGELAGGYETAQDTLRGNIGQAGLVTGSLNKKKEFIKDKFENDFKAITDTLELSRKEKDISLAEIGITETERKTAAEQRMLDAEEQLASVQTSFLGAALGT